MYVELAPTEVDLYANLPKLRKACSEFSKNFGESKALFVNYQYEDGYNHLLSKLISLIMVLPDNLRLLILGLPQGATYVDTHLAEHLQRMLHLKKQS